MPRCPRCPGLWERTRRSVWEDLESSREIRKQAALVLGKLEPVFYELRVYDKLLHLMYHDADAEVRDAAYGTLVRLARIRDRQAER